MVSLVGFLVPASAATLVMDFVTIRHWADEPIVEETMNEPRPALPVDRSIAVLHRMALPFKAAVFQNKDSGEDRFPGIHSHICMFAIREAKSYAFR